MFQRFFFGRADGIQNENERTVPEIEDDQPLNKFNEIVILNGHTDSVNSIIKIDEYRILTTSHDKKGIVWDCKTGDILCELIGHTRTIVSAIILENYVDEEESFCDVIVTASTDQTIRVWELMNGRCRKVIKEHQGTIKCFRLVLFEPMLVISAGQDICLWNPSFQLLSKFQRNSLDLVYDMKHDTNDVSNGLYEIKEFKRLPPHRQAITALVLISDAMFASASMDGAIIIWTTHRLDATRKFNHYEVFMNAQDHTYPYSVHHVLVAEQRYIFAAIGSGFAIYDAIKDRCICNMPYAHHSQVTCMALLDKGSFLATSSLDGTIRLWAAVKNNSNVSKANEVVSPVSTLIGQKIQNVKSFPVKLQLVGQCSGHSNSVQSIVGCADEGFVSCDNDGLVILWKDSKISKRRRDAEFRSIISKLGWLDH